MQENQNSNIPPHQSMNAPSSERRVVGIYQPGNPLAGPASYMMSDGTLMPMQQERNYINPDEVYFADANRPRDQYGFPIRPGQQMGKWDMRSSLKNTYLEHCSVAGFIKFNFDGSRPQNAVKIPLKEKVERSELDFQRWGGNILDVPNIEKYFVKEQKGKTTRRLQDGLLTIPQNGSYIIDYMVEVYHQSGWDLGTMTKLYTELTLYDENGVLVGELDRSAKYTITAPDYLGGTTIQSLQKGMKIGVGCKQKVQDNCAMRGIINIVKLS